MRCVSRPVRHHEALQAVRALGLTVDDVEHLQQGGGGEVVEPERVVG